MNPYSMFMLRYLIAGIATLVMMASHQPYRLLLLIFIIVYLMYAIIRLIRATDPE